jgi:hypothetical protein
MGSLGRAMGGLGPPCARYDEDYRRARRSSRASGTGPKPSHCPRCSEEPQMNTRTIAVIALVIAVIVLVILLA